MAEAAARALFDAFKLSPLGICAFSQAEGFHKDGLGQVFRRHFPAEYDECQERKAIARDEWYRIGRKFEYQVRDLLLKHAWWVLLSPGSRSPVDLVAIRDGAVLFIQCKHGQRTLLRKEKQPLLDAAEKSGSIPLLAYRASERKISFRRCRAKGYTSWCAFT